MKTCRCSRQQAEGRRTRRHSAKISIGVDRGVTLTSVDRPNENREWPLRALDLIVLVGEGQIEGRSGEPGGEAAGKDEV